MFKSSGLISKYLNRFISILIIILLLLSYLSITNVQADDDAGWSLSFDGVNDYVALGITEDILGMNWKTTKSISVWIKPTGDSKLCLESDVYDVAVCDAIIVDQPHFFGIARGIVDGEDKLWVWNFDGLT